MRKLLVQKMQLSGKGILVNITDHLVSCC